MFYVFKLWLTKFCWLFLLMRRFLVPKNWVFAFLVSRCARRWGIVVRHCWRRPCAKDLVWETLTPVTGVWSEIRIDVFHGNGEKGEFCDSEVFLGVSNVSKLSIITVGRKVSMGIGVRYELKGRTGICWEQKKLVIALQKREELELEFWIVVDSIDWVFCRISKSSEKDKNERARNIRLK